MTNKELEEPKTIRFCEFTGDGNHVWDEVDFKRKCRNIGIMHKCLLHKKPLGEFEGWRVCCEECTTPVQVKAVPI